MTNVLLTKDYQSNKAGAILSDVSDGEASAIKALGLGEVLKEEPAKAEAKGKGDKGTAE